jgi:ribokinase
MKSGPIVVVGSVNMDLVCRVPRMAGAGETILGSDLVTVPGGKGANQAVAAAKLARRGTDVYLLGRVGDDDFGQRLMNGLNHHGVKTDYVTVTEAAASGCAMILVDRKGENSIVVAPGANQKLSPADIDAAEQLLVGASVVVMQLEIPFETVNHVIALCQRAGVRTILDPAPVGHKLPRTMYGVDIFTPNQHEAEALTGPAGIKTNGGAMGRMKRTRRVDAKQMGSELLSRGARNVVLKLGGKGSMILENKEQGGRMRNEKGVRIEQVKGFEVDVVDTTAAGDAFTGALAVGMAEEMELPQAVRFANAAGAICCQTFGAQPALPTRASVDKLVNEGA